MPEEGKVAAESNLQRRSERKTAKCDKERSLSTQNKHSISIFAGELTYLDLLLLCYLELENDNLPEGLNTQ
jgi:hypothetical protein